jgi:molybdopterin-binding protein
MKTTIFSVALILFVMNVIMAIGQEQTEPEELNWVSGIIESIQSGKENSLITVTMQGGESFTFSSTNDKVEGVEIGESILAKVVNGWAQSIAKLGKPVEIRKPTNESEGFQWVSGKVSAIRMGKETSLVSVEMSNGETFNFSATNQMLHGITIGDRVRAKVYKGWAETVATDGGHS